MKKYLSTKKLNLKPFNYNFTSTSGSSYFCLPVSLYYLSSCVNQCLSSLLGCIVPWVRTPWVVGHPLVERHRQRQYTIGNKKAQLSLTNPRDACEKFARFTQEQWGGKLYS